MKINEIIKLSDAFAAEVNVLRDYSYRNPEGNIEKIKGYLPNKSSREIIKSILLSCPESTDKKLHLITASYGTGKSYLLLMLANLLSNNNKSALSTLIEKIYDKEDYYKDMVSSILDNHIENSTPFLVVIPEYGDPDFNHALLESLKFALDKNNIDYVPKTNYEEAIKTIRHWENKNPQNYALLKDFITNNTVEKFIEQLQSYNPSTYLEFKTHFKDIIGANYPESHTTAYPVYADTAKEVRKHGFRGIAIIYDEFGEMLGKLINSSSSATGISVQDFLENVKSKKDNCNIIFISASHQDPSTLRANKEKELNKIIGRFEKHHLMVSESEGEEIIGAIFIKENQEEFDRVYSNSLFKEHLENIKKFRLYPDKEINWIENKILKNLYPLHPLTSYILPRLSGEFAQNTRSMFNFLSPNETKEGAFRYYLGTNESLESGKVNLFTPDLLLEFFLKNIREDKEGRIQSLYDAYRTSIGKVINQYHQSIMRNIFMLWVVNMATIRPTKETLFWAMNWEESKRKEFYFLLDDLTSTLEYLELNPTDNNYQFPDLGSAPISKIIDEEEKKLGEVTLADCLKVWEEIEFPDSPLPRDHNNRFGCNRIMEANVVDDIGYLKVAIKDLEGYYNNSVDFSANLYLFYLIGLAEDEIEELKHTIQNKPSVLPYIIYATPVNLSQFDVLKNDTIKYKAILNTSARIDIMQNPARLKSIQDQLQTSKKRLEIKLKELYDPSNWKWNYNSEYDVELTSKLKFSNWFNSKVDLIFSETPTIKDDALWFTDGNRGAKDRKQALDLLLNSDKDRIPLRDENSNSADKRIIRNFFANIELTSDKKRDRNIQYGEIKLPDSESQVYNAWKVIDSKLKAGSFVDPTNIIIPLLQEPFGFSEHIIKFLLTAYIRYDIERINIADSKRRHIQTITVDLIDSLISRPSEYVIRKIEMTGPELRYLGQLKSLFDKQDVNTWLDISQKFIGMVQFLSPFHKGIIRDSGDKDLQNFYMILEDLKAEYQSTDSNKERVSHDFFQEHLPSLLLNEGKVFMDDPSKVTMLIKKVEYFKKYPWEKEVECKLDVIQALANEVFGCKIVVKTEITNVVLKWFKELPSPNQNGKFSDQKIKDWLFEIKMPTNSDPFELYLENLSEKPFKDWDKYSYEKHRFISRFSSYKKTVEEYTKSPIEVLQIIARSVFEKSAAECSSEQTFDSYFKDWWSELSNLHKAEQYSPPTNLLISQINLSAAVKARYLETIPQVWKQDGYLPEYIPTEWESWSYDNALFVGEKYQSCLQEILQWKPPVEETELFSSLGKLFSNSKIESFHSLYEAILIWHKLLPERTKLENWKNLDENVESFLGALVSEDALHDYIMDKLLVSWKLPEFKQWNNAVLEEFLTKFQYLKNKLDNYRRPVQVLVEKIEDKLKERSSTPEQFCFNLNLKIVNSEAYKNKVDTKAFNNAISTLIYQAVSKNILSLPSIISLVSTELSISNEWHFWSDKDEINFVKNFNKAVDTITKWKIPEAEKVKKAKIKVKDALSKLKTELDISDIQMRKVLNDILEDN